MSECECARECGCECGSLQGSLTLLLAFLARLLLRCALRSLLCDSSLSLLPLECLSSCQKSCSCCARRASKKFKQVTYSNKGLLLSQLVCLLFDTSNLSGTVARKLVVHVQCCSAHKFLKHSQKHSGCFCYKTLTHLVAEAVSHQQHTA